MSVPPGRPPQQLTPPRILLVAVVCLLVLLLLVLLVQRATNGGGEPGAAATPTASATTTEDATAEPAPSASAPAEVDDVEEEPTYFASPSGNIACVITADSADCVIASFSYEPQDAAQCDGDAAGDHLRVEEAGSSMPCDPLVVAGDVPPLDYGEQVAAHGFTCDSEESGVTCRHDATGYGFSVARAAYDLF